MSPIMDRSKRAGRFLDWKVRIFAVGATLALGGMYLDKQWLVGVAIVVLAVGVALRFLPDDDGGVEESGDPEDHEEEDDEEA